MKYYTHDAETKSLEALKLPVIVDGRIRNTILPDEAATLGAYPRGASVAPTSPDGKIAVADDWEVQDGAWVRTWRYEDAPPQPPRRWSRLSIKTALAQAGILSQALAYLAQVEIAQDYSAAAALQDCDYIEEGYGGAEKWNALLDGAASALGKTRAEIDSFLAQIPTEGAR